MTGEMKILRGELLSTRAACAHQTMSLGLECLMYMGKLITGMTTNEGIKHCSGSSRSERGPVPFGNSRARFNVVAAFPVIQMHIVSCKVRLKITFVHRQGKRPRVINFKLQIDLYL